MKWRICKGKEGSSTWCDRGAGSTVRILLARASRLPVTLLLALAWGGEEGIQGLQAGRGARSMANVPRGPSMRTRCSSRPDDEASWEAFSLSCFVMLAKFPHMVA